MAQAFNLTAQLQLQSPRNVNQVVNDIRRQLKPIGVQLKIENTRNLARANKDLAAFSRNARDSNKNMSELNRTLQESARRFSVITIATGSFLALANAFKKSVKEAIAFERELVKISQVTGKSVSQLKELSQEVTRLSTTLGASSSDLLNVARTLSQAGFAADDARKALDILAKTTLAATFDNIQDTTEGAIALLRQFGDEAKRSGGDIKFLESSLDAINAVSKRFAVESGDLITAIRRTGGVFSAAGGSINELIALFTSVRATTRESAETIATGLRTIFTRIQRVETIDQLRTLGIELQDAQGNFVGAFEAFKRLSQGLKSLDPRSTAFSQIVEDLGGFRQVGKVIPLIQQFTTAQQALAVAQGASGSTARDAQIAQQSLGVQIQKVREEFDALIRKFADSSTFRSLANGTLELAKAFIKIADSLEPLLPLLVSFVGLKLGKSVGPALGSLVGIGKRAGGSGPVTKFASGGMVPGSGNRDTVPAMLTPGEFVIRKSSVNKLGAGTLAAMNQNGFNAGGLVDRASRGNRRVGAAILEEGDAIDTSFKILKPDLENVIGRGRLGNNFTELTGQYTATREGLGAATYGPFIKNLEDGIVQGVNFASSSIAKDLGLSFNSIGQSVRSSFLNSINEGTRGNLFEDILGALSGGPFEQEPQRPFDFPNGVSGILRDDYKNLPDKFVDAKASFSTASVTASKSGSLRSKTIRQIRDEILNSKTLQKKYLKDVKKGQENDPAARQKRFQTLKRSKIKRRLTAIESQELKVLQDAKNKKEFASGGGVPGNNGVESSDTVPALLTPGEFVFNKKAADSIGRANLDRMNKQGVQGYAKGGLVGFRKYATGTGPLGATSAGTINFKGVSSIEGAAARLSDVLNKMGVSVQGQAVILDRFSKNLEKGGKVSDALTKSLKGTDISVKNVGKAKKEEEEASKKAAKATEDQAKASSKFNEGLEKFRGVTQAAQSFVFLGGSVAALATQFVEMEDTTSKALTETIGMITATVGVAGTLFDLGASVVQMAATSGIFTAAVTKMSAATEMNTQVTNKNTLAKAGEGGSPDLPGGKGGVSKLALAGTAAVAALTVFATGMYYFGAKARAEADKLAKGFDDALKRMSEGRGGSGEAANALRQEMIEREKAANVISATTVGIGALTVGIGATTGTLAGAAAAGALAGGALGSFAPVIGTAIGAIVGLTVGAIGYYAASATLTEQAKKEAEARENQVQNILKSISALQEFNNAILAFEKERTTISNTAGLSEDKKLDLNLTNLETLQGASRVNFQTAQGTTISGEQQARRVANRAGVSVAAFEGMSQEDRQQKLEDAGLQAADAAAQIALFKIAIAESTAAEKRRSLALSESATLFSQALQDVDPNASLQSLTQGDTNFARAYRARDKALKDQARAEVLASLARKRAAEKQLKDAEESGQSDTVLAGFQAEVDNANTALDASAESYKNYNQALNEGILATQKVKQAEIANAERLAKASQELRESMIETAKTVSFFADQTTQYQEFQNQQQDRAAVESGGLAGLRASGITEKELTPTINVGRFESEFDNLISTVGDPAIKANVEKAKDTALSAAGALSDIYSQSDSIIGAERISEAEARDLFKNIDLSALGPGLQEEIFKKLSEASVKAGGLQFEDLNQLLEELQTKYGQQVQIADQITKRNQEYLKAYDGFLAEIQDKYNAELEFRKRVVETQERAIDSELKARNIIAESLDKDPETVDRAAAQARRNAAAQANLNAAGVTSAAGDIGGLGAERKALQASVRQLTKDISAATTDEAKAGLKKEQQEQQIRLKAVNDELARLSNQSDAVNEIFTEMQHNVNTIKKEISEREQLIEVEKRARQQMYSVLQDFVVGGPEDRQRLGQAAMGVQFAYGTGTLQNQTPEQRQATVGLLDQLSGVEIAGAFRSALSPGQVKAGTGENIKQELVFRDAIRMGLAPEIAKEIATATSKEQQLIDQVEDLKKQLVDVNTDLLNELKALNQNMSDAVKQTDPNRPDPVKPPPLTAAGGGYIQYRAKGGSIFKPKGTDTVPAMLSPGEFVIRKSAVDQIGVGNLQALNDGGGAVPGFAKGGLVGYFKEGDEVEETPEQRRKRIQSEGAKGPGDIAQSYIVDPFNKVSNSFTGRNTGRKGSGSRSRKNRGRPTFQAIDTRDINNLRIDSAGNLDEIGKIDNLYGDDLAVALNFLNSGLSAVGVTSTSAERNERKRRENEAIGNQRANVRREEGRRKDQQAKEKVQKQLEKERLAREEALKPKPFASFSQGAADSNDDSLTFEAQEKRRRDEVKRLAAEKTKELESRRPSQQARDMGIELRSTEEVMAMNNPLSGVVEGLEPDSEFFKNDPEAYSEYRDKLRKQKYGLTYDEAKNPSDPPTISPVAPPATSSVAPKGQSDYRKKRDQQFEEAKAARNAGEYVNPLRARQRARFGRDEDGNRKGVDVDSIRRERGMRSRGRTSSGQKFGTQAGSGLLNFMSGYGGGGFGGGGFGGGGPQSVPFGFIPGSPYNQLLGRGGYNIPRFDPRLLFGNVYGVNPYGAFYASGGSVGGDTIPAMLTPGEFVMSAGAVKKHGVGLMNKLNKGNVQGFNKGGSVGGVQYRQTGGEAGVGGGMLGFDVSEIQGAFDGFVSNFSSVFSEIVAPFSGIADSLNSIAASFGNFSMNHNVTVDGLISIGGLNIDSIASAVSQSVGQLVSEKVQAALNNQTKGFNSNTPGQG